MYVLPSQFKPVQPIAQPASTGGKKALGDFNFKNVEIFKRRGVPLRVLENDVWKTGFKFSPRPK